MVLEYCWEVWFGDQGVGYLEFYATRFFKFNNFKSVGVTEAGEILRIFVGFSYKLFCYKNKKRALV